MLGDHVTVSHLASFFTALPLSTAGEVFSIHEWEGDGRVEAVQGVQPGGRGERWGCTNTSRLLKDAAHAPCGTKTS